MPRRLLYVVPTVAALVAGFALVGPGKARGVDAAKVLAVADASGRVRSVRVVAAHREDQRDTPITGDVRVASGDAGSVASLEENGVAEVRLTHPITVGDETVVTVGGRVVARGPLRDVNREDLVVAPVWPGKHEGALHVTPHLSRGPLAPPFADELTVDATDAAGKPIDAAIDVHLDGATCETCAKRAPPAATRREPVTPIGDQVEIEISARAADGRTGTFAGKISTAMGSLWLAPPEGKVLRVVAATPKDWAFVSFFDDEGRVAGATLRLAPRADGFYDASLEAPAGDRVARYVVLSTDENEAGRTATAWALRPEPLGSAPKTVARVGKVLDGFPDAVRRERERLRRVHFILAGFVVALALLEIALLGLLARGTRRDLTQHFERSFEATEHDQAASALQPIRSTLVVVGVVALLVALSAAALVGLTVFTR